MHRSFAAASMTTLLALAGGTNAGCALNITGARATDGGVAAMDARGPLSDQDAAGILPETRDAGVAGPDAPVSGARGEADFSDDGSSCLDFLDNNGDGIFDCDDPVCQDPVENLACCVGSTAEACCDAVTTFAVVEGSCGATPCLSLGTETLTTATGRVVDSPPVAPSCATGAPHAFAPFGRTGAHAFMVLPRQIDARAAHVRITARLGAGSVTGTEVAAAGFGLFTEQGMGAIARPLVAVVTSATSNDVRVIVGDRVIATRTLSGEGCGQSLEYAIAINPDGNYRVESRVPGALLWDATPIATGTCELSADARIAMFGQQPNPDGAPVVWVSDLGVEQNGCDVLVPARRSAPIVASRDDDVTGLSIFARSGGSYEALVTSGDQIHWLGLQSASGGLVSSVPADPFADNIQPTWPDYRHFRDVEVVEHAGTYRVYLAAARADDGVFEIVGTTYTPSATPGRPGVLGSSLSTVTSAAQFPADMDRPAAFSVDGPSAAVVPGVGLVLLARVRYVDGHDEIRVVGATLDGSDFETAAPSVSGRDASGATTDGLVHSSQTHDEDAFDRDEIADPQIVVIDGVARVLFAGRRGTRWSIGSVVASPRFDYFIPVSDTPILGPSGAGFDALGVTEPTLVSRAGTSWLYFAGTDGARHSLGLAVQPILGATP